jgi:hypothetical protein
MKTNPVKIRLHYNKKKAKEGLPWTVHTSKGCFPASHVRLHTTMLETEEKPGNKHNPRYFLVTSGFLTWQGTVAVVFGK